MAKRIRQLKKRCTEYRINNDLRKYELNQWEKLSQKLLSEGRITKEELKEYFKRKKDVKIKALFK